MFSAFSTYVQVQVLPESRFWLRISIEFHLKKWDKKSPVTVVVTGFFAPISKSVRIVGCGDRTVKTIYINPLFDFYHCAALR
jgi:hypothetical protein